GVIHHTFSTRDAFDRLARLPRHGGRLFVWVYSPWDEERTFERRMMMRLERVVRPLAWRLPDRLQTALLLPLVPLYMARQKLDAVRNGKGRVAYGFREAIHAARDRFTPRFVHRHSDDEVSAWVAQAGYRDLTRASEKPRPDYVPIAFTASTGVDGVRA
ncbi:MAG TPA: hypothetical protein VFX50_07145, partial [Gemmatimonadales bacterium]|nr:hypothetical protein [Gemmatimonadales bacterium]